MKRTYKAWCVEADLPDHGWTHLGRFWWFSQGIPKHMVGHKLNAFDTRREAREEAKKSRHRTRVRRIKVTVEYE